MYVLAELIIDVDIIENIIRIREKTIFIEGFILILPSADLY